MKIPTFTAACWRPTALRGAFPIVSGPLGKEDGFLDVVLGQDSSHQEMSDSFCP